MANCAKKGSPSGGSKDTIAPVIVKSQPENYSINFDADEIRIYFDEYIKLKDLQTNLIISPPMKYDPVISPLSTSKLLKIKILDTLKENTTYSINFGKSIVDNNEENPFDYYKYVFSTGSYIDSLKVRGTARDALLPQSSGNVSVMLYEVTESYNDSIIYTEKPSYIAAARDSLGNFELTNVKAGRFLLMALEEKNSDYIFHPKLDKIAYQTQIIELPTDSSYILKLFREIPDYDLSRPNHVSKNEIQFGYTGEVDSLVIDLIGGKPQDYAAMQYKDNERDTIRYWFKPSVEGDSLRFMVRNKDVRDTLNLKTRNLYADSLRVVSISKSVFTPYDTLQLSANTPLVNLDLSKINIVDKDTVEVPFDGKINRKLNIAELYFSTAEEQQYITTVLPGALTDFFEAENDTLRYTTRTKSESDYGTISLRFENVKSYPIIAQLVNSKFTVIAEKYSEGEELLYFDYVDPGDYYVRIVYDENANRKWDTGNFLNRIQPEEVIYHPIRLEILANWSFNETLKLN